MHGSSVFCLPNLKTGHCVSLAEVILCVYAGVCLMLAV